MNTDEVPQDHNAALGGVRKAMYALDARGAYTTVPSSGWTVEEAVTGAAVDEFRRLAREAWDAVRRGAASPLAFHMYAQRMDEPMLAQTAGIWRWRVRRHLTVAGFARLDSRTLARYADALGVDAEALSRLPDAPPA